MGIILCVYKEVNLKNEMSKDGEALDIITISFDEKRDIQAIKNRAPDLPPKIGKVKRLEGIMNTKGLER